MKSHRKTVDVTYIAFAALAVLVSVLALMTCCAWAQETPDNWVKIKFTENNPQTPYRIYVNHAGGEWTPPDQPPKGYIPSSGEWIIPLRSDVWNVKLRVQYKKDKEWHTLVDGYVKPKNTFEFSSDGTFGDMAWYEKIVRLRYVVSSDTWINIKGHTSYENDKPREWSHSSFDKNRTDLYILPPEYNYVSVEAHQVISGDTKRYDCGTWHSTGAGAEVHLAKSPPDCRIADFPFRPGNGKWVEVVHKGWYDAKFYVVWKENGQERRWESGVKHGNVRGMTGISKIPIFGTYTDPVYRYLVNLPNEVNTVYLHAQAKDIAGWKTIVASDVPVRRIYEVEGTSTNPTYEVWPPLPAKPENWIRIVHKGAYMAKFFLQWEGQSKLWQSGPKHAGYEVKVPLPPDVKTVLINMQEHTGGKWKTILRKTDAPVQRTYTVHGTTLNPDWEASPPLK